MSTTVCPVDNGWESAAGHREISVVLHDDLDEWNQGWAVDGRPNREGIYSCIQ